MTLIPEVHLARMSLDAKVFDITYNPLTVRFFGGQAIMMVVEAMPNLLYQLEFRVGCEFGLVFHKERILKMGSERIWFLF